MKEQASICNCVESFTFRNSYFRTPGNISIVTMVSEAAEVVVRGARPGNCANEYDGLQSNQPTKQQQRIFIPFISCLRKEVYLFSQAKILGLSYLFSQIQIY